MALVVSVMCVPLKELAEDAFESTDLWLRPIFQCGFQQVREVYYRNIAGMYQTFSFT